MQARVGECLQGASKGSCVRVQGSACGLGPSLSRTAHPIMTKNTALPIHEDIPEKTTRRCYLIMYP